MLSLLLVSARKIKHPKGCTGESGWTMGQVDTGHNPPWEGPELLEMNQLRHGKGLVWRLCSTCPHRECGSGGGTDQEHHPRVSTGSKLYQHPSETVFLA